MEVRYHCPQCGADHLVAEAEECTLLDCSRCGYIGLLPTDWNQNGHVDRCPICGHAELYRQKDFNHRVAIAVLIGGALLAMPTRYVSLIFATILDLVLYLTAREVLICYTCGTQVRGHRPG